MTAPTQGVAHHPVITKVEFSTNGPVNQDPPAMYAGALLARTVRHLDQVTVEDLVTETLRARPDYNDLDYYELAKQRLVLEVLAESVLLRAQSSLRNRLGIDLATTLIPRLKGTRSP